MADEAFALSPISARATLPSEEDYDAISEAFMETSRGRWFLGEYAKRNRNADTRMVLDAVARIEQTIAAQRQPAPESGLAEALAAIRSAVDEARTAAEAINGSPVEENLAPVRKGARIIREIAWRWREIGADGRICDLLDSQVGAIEGACEKIASNAPLDALRDAFDRIEVRIAGFGGGGAATPRAAEEANPASSPDEMPAATIETAPTAAATDDADAAAGSAAISIELVAATAETMESTAEVAVDAETAGAMAEAEEISAEAAEAHDEAVLDLIALEMAADPSDLDDIPDTEAEAVHVAELLPPEPASVARQPEPIAVPASPPEIEPAIEPSLQPSIQPSLGSSLIASGIVRRPVSSEADPLAPIRRMSQAEKIAFFS